MASSTEHPDDPSTPTFTTLDDLTPTLSSASPDTPKKDSSYTPTILQTPTAAARMKGYSHIGVGVGARPIAPVVSETSPAKQLEHALPNVKENPDVPRSTADFGLGYGIELDAEDMIEMTRGEGSRSSTTSIQTRLEQPEASAMDVELPSEVLEDKEDDKEIEFPSTEEMKGIQDRLSSEPGKDDLVSMVKSLLDPCMNQLPLLREQLDAQKATIQTMQHQAELATQLSQLERDRHTAERTGWHREMKALVRSRDREIAAGKRPRKGLELNVGYHQELEASNKRLEMDNRLMAPRLADTQRQIDKLVNELRHLRSNVIMATSTIDSTDHEASRGRRKSLSPSRPIFNATTMGDARSEHLLLAARKVRSMRAADPRVGMLTMEELKRSGVVGPEGGLGYTEGYGENTMEESGDDGSEDEDGEGEDELGEDRKPIIPSHGHGHSRKPSKSRGGNSVTNTPLQRSKKGVKQNFPAPPTTPRSRKAQTGPPPTTTPGGSNFSDLLRAAEMATRPQTPRRDGDRQVPMPMSAMSATRTRMREESVSERGSPVKKARRVEGQTIAEGEEAEESALDLLAQASQLEVAQGDTPEAEPIPFSLGSPSEPKATTQNNSSGLEPPIDLYSIQSESQQQLKTPLARPRNLSISGAPPEIKTPRAHPSELGSIHQQSQGQVVPATEPPAHAHAIYQNPSPTGPGSVPGLGKYVHLSSSMPARRVRSPYLKWTIEEDELLARAVAIHGEKWDLVSKGVPTRSYHQVRQRWLRKTGAFDKKQNQGQTTPGDHHGPSTLGLGLGMPLPMTLEDREGSPTPQSGRNKKARVE